MFFILTWLRKLVIADCAELKTSFSGSELLTLDASPLKIIINSNKSNKNQFKITILRDHIFRLNEQPLFETSHRLTLDICNDSFIAKIFVFCQ